MFLKVLEYQFQLKSYKQIPFEEVRDPAVDKLVCIPLPSMLAFKAI